VRFSLDTNILVEVLRRRNTASRAAFSRAVLTGQPLVASILVHHELLFGVAMHPEPDVERRNVQRLMDQIAIEPFNRGDFETAAIVRADLRRRGLSIGPYDVLIASQALSRGWTILTSNVREFSRVSKLQIADWPETRELWTQL